MASRLRSSGELQRQVDRLKTLLECESVERDKSEQVRRGLMDQLDSLTSELERLQAAHSELRRQWDQLEDEKSDVCNDLERQQKDNERWYVSFFNFYYNNSYNVSGSTCSSSSEFDMCVTFSLAYFCTLQAVLGGGCCLFTLCAVVPIYYVCPVVSMSDTNIISFVLHEL